MIGRLRVGHAVRSKVDGGDGTVVEVDEAGSLGHGRVLLVRWADGSTSLEHAADLRRRR